MEGAEIGAFFSSYIAAGAICVGVVPAGPAIM